MKYILPFLLIPFFLISQTNCEDFDLGLDIITCEEENICIEPTIIQNTGNENSLSFNGVDNYINAGNVVFIESDYASYGVWIKSTENTGSTQYIIGKSDTNPGATLGIFPDGTLYFAIGTTNNSSIQGYASAINDNCNETYNDNKWHFVVGTYDGGDIKIYVDGQLKGQNTLNGGPINYGNLPLHVGYRPDNTSYFKGLMSDIFIVDYALNQDEIESYFCNGLTGNENGLKAYWPMNEGLGGTLFESGSNSINIGINNASWSNESKPSCSFYDYNWSNGQDSQTIQVSQSGNYSIDVSNSCEPLEFDSFTYGGYFNGSNYYISNQPNEWDDAYQNCIENGGELAIISSEEENFFLNTLCVNPLWFGFTDVSNEGNWQWVDGSDILYTNWLDNQPDNAWGGQNYGIMDCASGQWDDAGGPNTEEIQYYLMEIECEICSGSDEINVLFNICGCTDETACNYNSDANEEDGSCLYMSDFTGVIMYEFYDPYCSVINDENYQETFGDGFTSYSIYFYPDGTFIEWWFSCEVENITWTGTWEGCENGQITWYYGVDNDSYGENWEGAYFIGEIQDNQDLYIVGQYYNTGLEEVFEEEQICGSLQFYNCNDESALNYNSISYGDEDCIYDIEGCLDDGQQEWSPYPGVSGYNYNPFATITNENCPCLYLGCIDSTACNYNPDATIDDNSCEYISPIDLGEDIITCEEFITLDAGEGYGSYEWSTGETTQTIEVSETGDYNVQVTNGTLDNYSMNFDNNDNIEITIYDEISELDSYTFNAWVKIDETDDFQPIFWIGSTDQSELEIYTINGITDAGSGLRVVHKRSNPNLFNYNIFPSIDSTWVFLSIVFNEGLISVYYNNQEQIILDNGNDILFSNISVSDINIGFQDAGSGTQTINLSGFVDDISFFNTVLSQNEREQIMNCSLSGDENDLIAYWNFEEGTEEGQVLDLSSNGNNGIINGATYSEDVPEQNCSTTNCSLIDEISVIFNEIYILENDLTICKGDTVQLTSSQDYNIAWSNNETTSEILVSPFETTTYTLEYSIDDIPCVDSIIITVENCGCMDELACNYCLPCTLDDNSCLYPEEDYLNCSNECITDLDNDNICDEIDECIGQYDLCGICNGEDECLDECGTPNGNGANYTCWDGSISCSELDCPTQLGCTDEIACNYCNNCTTDNNLCIYENECENCENPGYIQSIELPYGWSLFSTYICPFYPSVSLIMEDIVANNDLIIVKNETGNVYWPLFNINSIGDLTNGKGYQIKTNNPTTLNISGDILDYSYPIDINEGWAFIGYLHQEPYSINEMLSPIADNVVIVKDYSGNVYWPMFNINSIQTMNPGEGYQIKVSNNSNLSYPESNNGRYENNINLHNTNTDIINTGNNMTIGIPDSSWENRPEDGDEITIYDSNNLIVGRSKYREEGTVITVWGDDDLSTQKDGLYENEKYHFKLYSNKSGNQKDIIVKTWIEGGPLYKVNGINICGSIKTQIRNKEIIKVTDLIGREVNIKTTRTVLLYIYNDGTVETKYIIE